MKMTYSVVLSLFMTSIEMCNTVCSLRFRPIPITCNFICFCFEYLLKLIGLPENIIDFKGSVLINIETVF